METLEAIMTRRSVRRYMPDPIDDEIINKVLEAGRWAPSWANTQCWRFVVVRDPETKDKIANSLTAIVKSGDLHDNPGLKAVRAAPVLIVAAAETGISGCRSDDRAYVTDKGDWYLFDVALAVENMLLAAHSMGLGTVIIGAFDAPMVEEILGVPEGYRAVTVLPLGVPERASRTPPRKELAEITFKDRWGNR
jgi:nitroreductase